MARTVVGMHELLRAEADSDDRLPERERILISMTDFPADLPDGRPRRGRLLAQDVLGLIKRPRTIRELVDALADVGVEVPYHAVRNALGLLQADGLAAPQGRGRDTPWRRTRTGARRSRGPGSGSRMRLWECSGCDRPQKIRVASDDFAGIHTPCGTAFVRAADPPSRVATSDGH